LNIILRVFIFLFSIVFNKTNFVEEIKYHLITKALALMEGKILAIFFNEIGMTTASSSKKKYNL
jgi:hypothetical protein